MMEQIKPSVEGYIAFHIPSLLFILTFSFRVTKSVNWLGAFSNKFSKLNNTVCQILPKQIILDPMVMVQVWLGLGTKTTWLTTVCGLVLNDYFIKSSKNWPNC